ncbi:hypothetical protein PG993_003834 [Apiospora rasikravindrae]|uniref:Uncharacterized protein n=1 Tax=Apiospora rasikravindrae TaxID=990691 RepID=A0ABR1U0M6_9PEZI
MNERGVNNLADCFAAIKGEKVPQDIHSPVAKASLIRGIRLHYSFATSTAVNELCDKNAQLARARNARLIMSNQLPEQMAETERPYCIWHPDLASEDTYRQLARQYPQMRYHAGRACAAAGYHGLYLELDLLPDVSIAEEAREGATDGGRLIYQQIMSYPCRYSVMDDLNRSVELDKPPCPAFLNGNTQVRWWVESRVQTPGGVNESWGFAELDSIEEDSRINDTMFSHPELDRSLHPEEVWLLYEPLPLDLPTMKKTLLIEMAAYDGNVDRYARLRPPLDPWYTLELLSVLRGIYHHTMFARWWGDQIMHHTPRAQTADGETDPIPDTERRGWTYLDRIKQAISARRIMVNAVNERDLEELEAHGWPRGVPYPQFLWWPHRPDPGWLKMLADYDENMVEVAAITAIVCDYKDLYLIMRPRFHGQHATLYRLLAAAQKSPNPFYAEDLEKVPGLRLCGIVDNEEYWVDDYEPAGLPDGPGPVEDSLKLGYGPYHRGQAAQNYLAEHAVFRSMGLDFTPRADAEEQEQATPDEGTD